MAQNCIKGQLIVTLTEGDIIPATCVRAEVATIAVENGPISTKVDPLMLKQIYEITAETSAEQLIANAESEEERNTLTKTLCGVLEIEHLLRKYHEETKLTPQRIAIFGSSSLTLTILPGRTSHDVDAATRGEFAKFCETRTGKSHGNQAEISSLHLLNYLGQWEERASELTGILGTHLLLLHPLDTIMQKLLRIDQNRFESNDKPDITKILEILNPTEEVLVFLLTENANRYRIPASKAQGQAVGRNTTWFLDTFLRGAKLDDIMATAEAQEEQYLREKGLAPLALPKQSLQKIVRRIALPDTPPR